MERRWLLAWLLVAVAVGQLVVDGLLYRPPMIDFHVFLDAAEALRGGRSPYIMQDYPRWPYIYPQAFALLLIPLTWLPETSAEWAWRIISLGAVAFVALMGLRCGLCEVARRGTTVESQDRRWLAMLAFGSAFAFSPVYFGLNIGQADLLLAAILSGILVLPERHRAVGAGVILGVAVILKVSPALLLPVVVLAFGLRALIGFLLVLLCYVLFLWMSGLLPSEQFYFSEPMAYNQLRKMYPATSVHQFVNDWLLPPSLVPEGEYYRSPLMSALQMLLLGGYAATGLWLHWKRAGWLSLLALGIAWSHLASPMLEPHHAISTLVVLVPLLVIAAKEKDRFALASLTVLLIIGVAFNSMRQLTVTGLPAYSLLLMDVALLVLVLRRRDYGESVVLWLPLMGRARIPVP